MIIDGSEKFLLKQTFHQGPKELYNSYVSKIDGTKGSICAKSIIYLKQFVNYSPYLCLKIIRSRDNNLFSLYPWGNEYIHLLSLIAAYHLDNDEITQGLLWANKAITLVDYFAPTLNEKIREEILYNLPASTMVCAFPKQYLEAPCDKFFLDWEIKGSCYGNTHSNDN
jgi:hypothetical protein